MIRVLVAEDSPTLRHLLVEILQRDPEIAVVGEATTGREAVDLTLELRPDLVTMDIHMPVLDGFEATREIMVRAPTPILIVSSQAQEQDVALSLNATKVGALMVLRTPPGPDADDFEKLSSHLLKMVKAMARLKVVRRWEEKPRLTHSSWRLKSRSTPARLIALAASTGGPAAIQTILKELPRSFPAPILAVQHISSGFVQGLCLWLTRSCRLRVKIAEEGEMLWAGTVYLAPDEQHLGVGREGTVKLTSSPPIGGFRPSANYLFTSVAEVYGAQAAAVILTGMGRDGVMGLQALKNRGGMVLAQDEATSVVYGMPKEAVQAGIVDASIPLPEIADRLIALTHPSGE